MNSQCDEIREMLVGYLDGELGGEELVRVEEHLAGCGGCRVEVEALERSLELVKVVWEDGAAELEAVGAGKVMRKEGFDGLRFLATAAVLALVLGGALVWRVMQGGGEVVEREPVEMELTMAEIEKEVYRAGLAAELLAMADFIGEQPGGEEYAWERYTYLAKTYPDTQGGKTAKIKLGDLRE